ncbi:KAT8 regulatory NSL complex subunit 2-like [Centruroides vittatus]|uniref:KAT8 regulatory NSL complex subunit 2-like n=1 Tax=Centruroides vittatus TaxID=120091 RepID=UPI00351036F3
MKMNSNKKSSSAKKGKIPQEKLFCNYVHRVCMQTRLDGYDYCLRHILEDKTAPFKQCSFVHPQNGKRCTKAAPKNDKKDGVCPWHARKALLNRRAASMKKTVQSPKAILEALEHYCAGPHDSQNIGGNWNYSSTDNGTHSNFSLSKFIDRDIDSDNERETTVVDQTWRKSIDSDNESIDSEQDDPLKHAGVYTAEEVAMITRDKLIKLQSLYIDQFKRLQHILREKRRLYVRTVKSEKETLGPIQNQNNDVTYQKLKALQRYHQIYGKEAILKAQYKERRKAISEGSNYIPPSYPKCVFQEDGHQCGFRTIPLSKYCKKHILSDPHQVLFKSCHGKEGDCNKPIIPYNDQVTCLYHAHLTSLPIGKSHNMNNPPENPEISPMETDVLSLEPEHFQSMDDIASLGLDVVQPGSLFGLNQFGDPGESTDSALSGDNAGDLIQPLSLNSSDILCTERKQLDQEVDK